MSFPLSRVRPVPPQHPPWGTLGWEGALSPPPAPVPAGSSPGQDSRGFPAPGERDGPLSSTFCLLRREEESIRPPTPTPANPLCYRPCAFGPQRDLTIANFSDYSEISVGPVPVFSGSDEARSRRHPLKVPKRELGGKPTLALPCLRFLKRSVQCFFQLTCGQLRKGRELL